MSIRLIYVPENVNLDNRVCMDVPHKVRKVAKLMERHAKELPTAVLKDAVQFLKLLEVGVAPDGQVDRRLFLLAEFRLLTAHARALPY